MPDVSVVIPTYNRRDFLEQALQSCFAGNETLALEVVVVDDGSTDGTREWLQQLSDERVCPLFQEHQGAQVARNRGMSEARGTFLKFLDDDDWLAAGSLTREVQRLHQMGGAICYGPLRVQEEGGTWTKQQHAEPDLPSAILRGSVWTHPHGFLYRRRAIEGLAWNPALPYHQDYAFATAAACSGARATAVGGVIGTIRRHGGLRIDTAKKNAPRDEYYGLKARLIGEGIDGLKEYGLLQAHHRRAAAAGLWTWAHILAGYDLAAFERLCTQIERIDASFSPSRHRTWLAGLDKAIGAKNTERVLYPLRRAKNLSSRYWHRFS